MKRYNNIYGKIYDIDNLRLAHKKARQDKTFYKEVRMVDSDEDGFLGEIQKSLILKTYEVSQYSVSELHDKGKTRQLMKLPYYPDRIVQWAILLQIEPIFMATFCQHVCASIKNRGIKRASELTDRYMRDVDGTRYCLKMDVKKFYQNVNHDILKKLLRKRFKDPDLLWLLDLIIDSYPGEKGIPIGSYLSQYFANFYLAYFDHWLKEEMGIKYVVRFMDDIVIFHESKEFLHDLHDKIDVYLHENLDLEVKENWQVFPTAIRGVDFVGYRHFYGCKLLRKSTCKKFKKAMLRILEKQNTGLLINYNEWCSANSYAGWLIWCDSWRLFEKYLEPIVSSLLRYYKEVIKSHEMPEKVEKSTQRYLKKLIEKKGRKAE